MVKFMIVFHKPSQQAAFENSYNDFLALVERMPNVKRRQVSSVLGSPMGDSPYYRVLEVYFDDYPQMQGALNSAAGQEAGGQLNTFPPGSFEMVFAEVFEEAGGHTPTP
ncbi:MAG: EthD family reductase [Chloroflexi bacterium]|nr:EthD family reductase [Chloroflexota bacterium]